MGDVFGKPAIVTDTHCIRLCNRIGLVDNEKNQKKVEMALWKIDVYKRQMYIFHHKTLHKKFTIGVPLILLIQVMIFICIMENFYR